MDKSNIITIILMTIFLGCFFYTAIIYSPHGVKPVDQQSLVSSNLTADVIAINATAIKRCAPLNCTYFREQSNDIRGYNCCLSCVKNNTYFYYWYTDSSNNCRCIK